MRNNGYKGSGSERRNPIEKVSRQDRKRYLDAAKKRQKQRQIRSLSRQFQKRDRKFKESAPDSRAHVLTDSWLENTTLDEARAKPVREIPAWLFPLLILFTLVLSLFVILPLLIGRIASDEPVTGSDDPAPVASVYGDEIMVARKAVVDVFSSPDIRSDRITQLLYNEAVTRLSPKNSAADFIRVRLKDGTEAYCRRVDLEEDSSSIEPDDSIAKLVVTGLTKRVMSHARNGNLLIEVKMNTELFVTYRSDPLYRVKLPGGKEGWLDSTGVLELRPNGSVELAGATYFSDSIMAFNHVTYLPHGISNDGASMENIIRMAAAVNGVNLDRGIEAVVKATRPVEGTIAENGNLNMNAFTRGDILFFSEEEGKPVSRFAIWVDYGIVLAERPREFVIRETDVNTILKELVFVGAGRLFEN